MGICGPQVDILILLQTAGLLNLNLTLIFEFALFILKLLLSESSSSFYSWSTLPSNETTLAAKLESRTQLKCQPGEKFTASNKIYKNCFSFSLRSRPFYFYDSGAIL